MNWIIEIQKKLLFTDFQKVACHKLPIDVNNKCQMASVILLVSVQRLCTVLLFSESTELQITLKSWFYDFVRKILIFFSESVKCGFPYLYGRMESLSSILRFHIIGCLVSISYHCLYHLIQLFFIQEIKKNAVRYI